MQVLLVTQEFPPDVIGGVGYHAYHLAEALLGRGHDVHVLTGTSAAHASDDSLAPLAGVSVSTVRSPRTLAPRLWFARRARRWLQSWDRLDEFDVLHAHEYLDFGRLDFDGTAVQKLHFNLTEKPRYLSLDGVPGPLERVAFALARPTVWRAERRLERRAVETADVTIANSRLTRAICRDRHGLESTAIEVVYNGVDVEQFTPSDGAGAGGRLLFVGGDSRRKGFRLLLEALGRLDHPGEVRVEVVGSVDAVDTTTLETTLPVRFLGRVPRGRLAARYRAADGLVHPARYEPFGNVVLESLACGTPVIVSGPSRCGAAELLDEESGIAVDPTDAEALAEAMAAAAAGDDGFSPSACRALAETHPWDRVAERTIDVVRASR